MNSYVESEKLWKLIAHLTNKQTVNYILNKIGAC